MFEIRTTSIQYKSLQYQSWIYEVFIVVVLLFFIVVVLFFSNCNSYENNIYIACFLVFNFKIR
jgi:hypothetical protein